MKICYLIRDLLPLYDDNALCPESREIVENHLKHCEGCRKALRQTRKQAYAIGDEEIRADNRYEQLLDRIRCQRVMEGAAFAAGIGAAVWLVHKMGK